MKAPITKTKFDFFHLILLFAAIAGSLFAVFIFKTARPQALKLIRWSPIEEHQEIIDSINKRQYALLKSVYTEVIIHGASKIDIEAQNFVDSLQKITQISAQALEPLPTSEPLPDSGILNNKDDGDTLRFALSPEATRHLITEGSPAATPQPSAMNSTNANSEINSVKKNNPYADSTTLNIFIEVYYFNNLSDLRPEEFYDPQRLAKTIKRAKTPPRHLFTAYQKGTDNIYIDLISIQ